MHTALAVAAREGKVLVIGDYAAARADFPWIRLVHQEVEIIGSNASAGAWPDAVALAVGRKVPLEALISQRLPASAGVAAVELVRSSRDLNKVVLEHEMLGCR